MAVPVVLFNTLYMLQSVIQERAAPVQVVVPTTHEILGYPEEITNTDGHPFKLLMGQEAQKCLLGQIIRHIGADGATQEAVDPWVAGLVEPQDDLVADLG